MSALTDATLPLAATHRAVDGGPTEPRALDVTLLRLLADPLRARIVQLLAAEQLCTCHLVELTGAGQTNISNHLARMRAAGVVLGEPRGRFTYYRLDPEVLDALGAALTGLAGLARTADRRPC